MLVGSGLFEEVVEASAGAGDEVDEVPLTSERSGL
jgi:hypothetical protein